MSENEKMNFSLGLIIAPILLSVYGQLVIKWRVNQFWELLLVTAGLIIASQG